MDNEAVDTVNLLFAEEEDMFLDRIVDFLDELNPNIIPLASSTFQTWRWCFCLRSLRSQSDSRWEFS